MAQINLDDYIPAGGYGGFRRGTEESNPTNYNPTAGMINWAPQTPGGAFAMTPGSQGNPFAGTLVDNAGTTDDPNSNSILAWLQANGITPPTDPVTGGGGTPSTPGNPPPPPSTSQGNPPTFAPTSAQVAANPGAYRGTSFDPTRSAQSEGYGPSGGANTPMSDYVNGAGETIHGYIQPNTVNPKGDGSVLDWLRKVDQVSFQNHLSPFLQQNGLMQDTPEAKAKLQQLGTGFFENLIKQGITRQGGGKYALGSQSFDVAGPINSAMNNPNFYANQNRGGVPGPQNTGNATPPPGGQAPPPKVPDTKAIPTGGLDPGPGANTQTPWNQSSQYNALQEQIKNGSAVNPIYQMMMMAAKGGGPDITGQVKPEWSFDNYTKAGGQTQGYDNWLGQQLATNGGTAPQTQQQANALQSSMTQPYQNPQKDFNTNWGPTDSASGGLASTAAGQTGGSTPPATPGAASSLSRPSALPGGGYNRNTAESGNNNNWSYFSKFA